MYDDNPNSTRLKEEIINLVKEAYQEGMLERNKCE